MNAVGGNDNQQVDASMHPLHPATDKGRNGYYHKRHNSNERHPQHQEQEDSFQYTQVMHNKRPQQATTNKHASNEVTQMIPEDLTAKNQRKA